MTNQARRERYSVTLASDLCRAHCILSYFSKCTYIGVDLNVRMILIAIQGFDSVARRNSSNLLSGDVSSHASYAWYMSSYVRSVQ